MMRSRKWFLGRTAVCCSTCEGSGPPKILRARIKSQTSGLRFAIAASISSTMKPPTISGRRCEHLRQNVRQSRVGENVPARHAAGQRRRYAVHDAADAALAHRIGAERTRLRVRIDGAIFQAHLLEDVESLRDGEKFSVMRNVMIVPDGVDRLANDLSATADHRRIRIFAAVRRLHRERKAALHHGAVDSVGHFVDRLSRRQCDPSSNFDVFKCPRAAKIP